MTNQGESVVALLAALGFKTAEEPSIETLFTDGLKAWRRVNVSFQCCFHVDTSLLRLNSECDIIGLFVSLTNVHIHAAAATTKTISSVCSVCGTMVKSGQSSCCGRGGSWFKNCGGAGNSNLDHTWYEGMKVCKKARVQSKSVTDQLLYGVEQKDTKSANDTINYAAVTTAVKTFIVQFTSTSFDMPTPTSEDVSIFTPAHVGVNVASHTSTASIEMLRTVPVHTPDNTSIVTRESGLRIVTRTSLLSILVCSFY